MACDDQVELKCELDKLKLFLSSGSLEDDGFNFIPVSFLPTPEDSLTSSSLSMSRLSSRNESISASMSSSSLSCQKKRNLRRCLDLNLEYQATLRNFIDVVQQAKFTLSCQMEDKRNFLKIEIESRRQRDCRRPTPIVHRSGPITTVCFRFPYFKNVLDMTPPPNPDVVSKGYYGHLLPLDERYQSGWKWYDQSMKNRLFREVRRECLSKILEPFVAHRNDLRKLVGELDGPVVAQVRRDLDKVENDIRLVVKNSKPEELFRDSELIDSIDWMKVAKHCGGSVNYSTCKLVWLHYHSPLINKRPFSKHEDTNLSKIAKYNNYRYWAVIAWELNTDRSPFQCLQRYQSKISALESEPDKKKLPVKREAYCDGSFEWTPEDENRLMYIIKSLGVQVHEPSINIDWHYVSQMVGHFSKNQCAEKYIQLSSSLNNGPWSRKEHEKLTEALNRYGCSDWISISNFVETRSPKQCCSHWTDSVRNETEQEIVARSSPDWTAEEDAILWFHRNSQSAYLRCYSEILRYLPGRLLCEAKARFKLLKTWKKQAEFLVKNDGTLLTLIAKSDAELTIAEMAKLRSELLRLHTRSRRKKLALSEKDAKQLSTVTFSEQTQLERLTNAMVLEASLSRELVREKITSLKEIAQLKAVPVPLLRKNCNASFNLDLRAAAFEKIREMLMRIKQKRGKSLPTQSHPQLPTPEYLKAKLKKAMMNPRIADVTREMLLQLESVNGGTSVAQLIHLSRQIDALLRMKRPANCRANSGPVTPFDWRFYRSAIGSFLLSYTKIRPNNLCFYDDSHKINLTGDELKQMTYRVAKLFVQVLGGNSNEMCKEATFQASGKLEIDEEDVTFLSKLDVFLNQNEDNDDCSTRLQRFCARFTEKVLNMDVDSKSTVNGSYLSIRKEFFDICNLEESDCLPFSTQRVPVLPPSCASALAYRHMKALKTKLRTYVKDSSPVDKDLVKKVEELRKHPSEGYSLLKQRLATLFTWPAFLDQSKPKIPENTLQQAGSNPKSSLDVMQDTDTGSLKRPLECAANCKDDDCQPLSSILKLSSPDRVPNPAPNKEVSRLWRGRGRDFAMHLAESAVKRHQNRFIAIDGESVSSEQSVEVKHEALHVPWNVKSKPRIAAKSRKMKSIDSGNIVDNVPFDNTEEKNTADVNMTSRQSPVAQQPFSMVTVSPADLLKFLTGTANIESIEKPFS